MLIDIAENMRDSSHNDHQLGRTQAQIERAFVSELAVRTDYTDRKVCCIWRQSHQTELSASPRRWRSWRDNPAASGTVKRKKGH